MLRVRLSLRGQVCVFTICVSLAIIGIYGFTTYHAHNIAVEVARRATQNLAASLAREATDTMEAADGALQGLVERVETDGLGRQARARLQDEMAQTIIAMPRLHGLCLIDERGSLLLDNTSLAGQPDLNFRDREYFRYHRAHPIRTARITGPLRSKTENVWVLDVSRRIDHADGRFAGVAVAQISLSYIEQTYADVDIGPAGIIDLVADDGTIFVRKPFASAYVGRTVAHSPIFSAPLKYQVSGTYASDSVLDGIRRLYAFQRSDRYPLFVIVALGDRDYLASWRADAVINLLAIVPIVVMIMGLGKVLTSQIAHRKRAEDALERLALLDGLTGIANRRQFDDVLQRQWLGAMREKTPLSLLMIDADHFKSYNDNFGHQSGDELLKLVATTIVQNIRPSDLGARYGGEEFGVVLPTTDLVTALKVAERIRAAVAASTLSRPDSVAAITVSVGVACIQPMSGDDGAALIAASDRALYEAKRAGRNRCVALQNLDPLSNGAGVTPSRAPSEL